jgi:hypothetical protein
LLIILVWDICIGISRPYLGPTEYCIHKGCTDGWFMSDEGTRWGNGMQRAGAAGDYQHGGRVGVLLGLGGDSLRFFRNGAQHGPGYAARSRQRGSSGSCSSANVQPQRERAATAKRAATTTFAGTSWQAKVQRTKPWHYFWQHKVPE